MNDEDTLSDNADLNSLLQKHKLDEDEEDEEFDENDTTEVGRFKERGEFTFRAIAVGSLIGILVGAMNVNFGLRTGWTQGGTYTIWDYLNMSL